MSYNPLIHHRRSIRLRGFDYSNTGSYFVTLNCRDRLHVFGHIHNGIMCLNHYGSIAYHAWLETTSIRPTVALGEFIIMPNHMHGIITIKEKSAILSTSDHDAGPISFRSPKQTIGAIIRGYKGSTTKRIKELVREEGGSGMGGDKIDMATGLLRKNHPRREGISEHIQVYPRKSDKGDWGDRS